MAARAALRAASPLMMRASPIQASGVPRAAPPSFPCVDQNELRTQRLLQEREGLVASTSAVRDETADTSGPEPAYSKIVSGYETFHHPESFELDYGGVLPSFDIAYETWGKLNADRSNAILLHTGLSASSHAHSSPKNKAEGWWERFIGPGKAIDTDRFFVICTNVLGGCYGSTGPSSRHPSDGESYATRFPIISIFDMVRAQFKLLDHLGIKRLHASVGSSMGGMQSVAMTHLDPERIGRVVSISGSARSSPSSIALRYAQRSVLMADPNWNRGFYYDGIPPHTGMKLARQIATITYRSGPEWEQRFGRRRRMAFPPRSFSSPSSADPDSPSLSGTPPVLCPDFLIETYLDHQGEQFCLKFDPNSLLYISKAMDLFDMSQDALDELSALRDAASADPSLREHEALCPPQTPRPIDEVQKREKQHISTLPSSHAYLPRLAEGLKNLARHPTLVLGVQSDILFPVDQQRELAEALRMNGNKEVSYFELDSPYGHDTFLVDLPNDNDSVCARRCWQRHLAFQQPLVTSSVHLCSFGGTAAPTGAPLASRASSFLAVFVFSQCWPRHVETTWSSSEGAIDVDALADDAPSSSSPAKVPRLEAAADAEGWQAAVKEMEELYKGPGRISEFTSSGQDQVIFQLDFEGTAYSISLGIDKPAKYMTASSWICYADDAPADIEEAADELSGPSKLSLQKTIHRLEAAIFGDVSAPPNTRMKHSSKSSRALVQQASSLFIADESADEHAKDDALFGISDRWAKDNLVKMAIGRELRAIRAAGFRPGYEKLSEERHVITCTVPIAKLKLPMKTLDAWDAHLANIDRPVRLVLIASYSPANLEGSVQPPNLPPRFAVGISTKARPSRNAIEAALQDLSHIIYTPDDFERISLSKPLDNVLRELLPAIFELRLQRRHTGWAGAEDILRRRQSTQSDAIDEAACYAADRDELNMAYAPLDSMQADATRKSLPLAAFTYLIRRFTLCTRFCLMCHAPVETPALKPYVCRKERCTWDYQRAGMGPGVEHEICSNPEAVDLLIQLAYMRAQSGSMTSFPELRLRVNLSQREHWKADTELSAITSRLIGSSMIEFALLEPPTQSLVLAIYINQLPSVQDMKAWIEWGDSNSQRRLEDIEDGEVHEAAWIVLRWILATNTSSLRPIDDANELMPNMRSEYRQYRFWQNSPEREAAYEKHSKENAQIYPRAKEFPDVWAFHGSAMENWFTICQDGLNFDRIANARAFGDGVYFAYQLPYSQAFCNESKGGHWRGSGRPVTAIVAVCQFINRPTAWVADRPFAVIDNLDWICPRYLLVRQLDHTDLHSRSQIDPKTRANLGMVRSPFLNQPVVPYTSVPLVRQDLFYQSTLDGSPIVPGILPLEIPQYVKSAGRFLVERPMPEEKYTPEEAEMLRND